MISLCFGFSGVVIDFDLRQLEIPYEGVVHLLRVIFCIFRVSFVSVMRMQDREPVAQVVRR